MTAITKKSALMLGAALLAGTASAASAQGYDWGGGHCVGYGCADAVHRDGYRVVRRYEEDVRPDMRVYERRIHRHHDEDDDDWDDDE